MTPTAWCHRVLQGQRAVSIPVHVSSYCSMAFAHRCVMRASVVPTPGQRRRRWHSVGTTHRQRLSRNSLRCVRCTGWHSLSSIYDGTLVCSVHLREYQLPTFWLCTATLAPCLRPPVNQCGSWSFITETSRFTCARNLFLLLKTVFVVHF